MMVSYRRHEPSSVTARRTQLGTASTMLGSTGDTRLGRVARALSDSRLDDAKEVTATG
jgi:hypothetical protein